MRDEGITLEVIQRSESTLEKTKCKSKNGDKNRTLSLQSIEDPTYDFKVLTLLMISRL